MRQFVASRPAFGEGDGTPPQYSCLGNPMDGGAWQATVHGVAKSRTRLSDFTFTFHIHASRRKWQPTPVFLPGESQGRGSLVGCCLWGCTESDTTDATQQQQQQQTCLTRYKLFRKFRKGNIHIYARNWDLHKQRASKLLLEGLSEGYQKLQFSYYFFS